jgi:1-acyl-sn-glycerol-3-phosphate acyltransferase
MSDQKSPESAAASVAAKQSSPPPPPPAQEPQTSDVDKRTTPMMRRVSSTYSLGSSFSRSGTYFLAAQARAASALLQNEGSAYGFSGFENESTSRFELPEFSTVSLLTVWGVDSVAGLFCLLLCDLYVGEATEFPLTFFLLLGAHLNLLAGVVVYLLGRKKFGAKAYRFYQPFVGGVRFVTLQFFGVTCVASSVLCCTGFGLLYDPRESHTHGFLSTVATLALFGNILILFSLRSFNLYNTRSDLLPSEGAGGAARVGGMRSGAAVLAEGGLNGVLRYLRRRPNAESALQVAMLVAQNVLSYVAISFPQLQWTISVFNFAITLACGALSIFFVSYRRDRGYLGLRLFLPRTWDTLMLWATRLFYALALFANVLMINASNEVVQSSSVLALQGFDVVSCIALLLFMRGLYFEIPNETATLPTGLFELGSLVSVASVFALAVVNVGIFFYVQNFPDGLNELIEGTAWTYHGVLIFVSEVAQLVSLLLAPLVYIAGVIIHGDRFRMLSPQREAITFPVLIMQGLSYLLYIAAVINFVLYVTSKVPTIAVLESNFSVLSVICMTTSIRIYTTVVLHHKSVLLSAGVTASIAESERVGQVNRDATSTTAATEVSGTELLKKSGAAPSSQDETKTSAAAETLQSDLANISYVMNSELTVSYLLCLTNIMLRLIVDVSLHQIWGDVQLPVFKLITVSNICFVACVPIAHCSARDKGIRVFHPFSGSGSFVALQVLGWVTYASFVITIVFSTILTMNSDKVPAELASVFNGGNVYYTLFGVLELLPVLLITLSIAIEARCTLTSALQQRLAKEAFLEIRRILREEATKQSDEEKAVMQMAFQTLMTAALRSFSLPMSYKMLRLYKESAAERHSRNDVDDDESLSGGRSDDHHDSDGESSDDSDWGEDSISDSKTLQSRQESARIIVILLCCASAAFFVIAAFTARVMVLSLAFAVIGMLVTTASCVGVHAGYGPIVHGNSNTYAPFMPFRGGSPFVIRQMAGWGCYAGAFLVTLISCVESAEVSATAMTMAAFLSVCSQVFILSSIPLFSDRRGEPTFLEVNGEGIVAVLTFATAIVFGRVYTSVIALFTGDAGRLRYLEDDSASRRTRVPFVLAVISLSLAVPCTLIALSRTKGQWQRAIRKTAGAATPSRGRSTSKRGTAAGAGGTKKMQSQRTKLAMGISNLLEVLVILLGTVAPMTVMFILYYLSTHYTPRLVHTVETYTPLCFLLTLMTLGLSVVPYLVNVGVPPFVITVRVTIVTWVLYGMPVVAASMLILPCVLVPRYSTWFLCGATVLLTLIGSFNRVRFAIKLAVYFSIGYLSYRKYVFLFQTSSSSSLSWLMITRIAVVHLLDCLLLGFWLVYIPTYSGKPFHTGAMRSTGFTNFARKYLFADAQRYFNFRVLVDDPKVHMRNETTQYLFSFHPHGVFPGTALFASLTEEWARKVGINAHHYVSTHVASIIFNVPIVRDFNLRVGALSVSRRTLEASLKRGNSVLIVTGGQSEMLHTAVSDTKMTLITQHLGFVRLAIAAKVPLVPLISFAENNVLGLVQFPRIQHITLKILGFPFPMVPYGRFGLPVPFRTRLTVVVGTPIEIPEGADESNSEDVRKLSEAYFKALKELFYRRRAEAGYPDMELELVNDKEEAAKRKAVAAAAKKA